jgi:hypothetical protein
VVFSSIFMLSPLVFRCCPAYCHLWWLLCVSSTTLNRPNSCPIAIKTPFRTTRSSFGFYTENGGCPWELPPWPVIGVFHVFGSHLDICQPNAMV